LSQTRVRLRALASLGLVLILFGAFAPASAASSNRLADPSPTTAVAPTLTASPPADDVFASVAAVSAALAARSRHLSAELTSTSAATSAAPAASLTRSRQSDPTTVVASTRIIALAESHIGARYAHGATGPHAFDCSGLVYRVFEDAGLGKMIAGLRSASALYSHFRARHMSSTSNPQLGDLVIFGGGSHVGIYIGNGRVVHAMVSGVAITRIAAVYPHFTTYVHLGLTRLRLTLPAAHHVVRATGAKVIETVRTTVALSLRSGASATARRLTVLHAGLRLRVIRISRDRSNRRWFEVIGPAGRVGWVAARYTR
jgi:cell wall-associated NlpC family hydrolase